MTDVSVGGRGQVSILRAEARSVLLLLSRKDVVARPLKGHEGSVQIVRCRAEGDRELGVCPQSVWLSLVARGLVEARGKAFTWVLTSAGRAALKAHARKGVKLRTDSGLPRAQIGQRVGSTSSKAGDYESPLAWLAKRCRKNGKPLIDAAQFEAGERLRKDFEVAQMQPRVTMSWSAASSSGTGKMRRPSDPIAITDRALAARDRVNRALSAVGPELAGILVDVCCCFQGLETTEKRAGWPRRSAKVILLLALTRLARHYGLKPDEQSAKDQTRITIRHWGEDDYRPVIACDPS